MQARITAGYPEGCFCKRLELPKGKPFAYQNKKGVFEFAKHAKQYAAENGLTDFVYQSKNKVVFAYLNSPCNHRERQFVRLSWDIFTY